MQNIVQNRQTIIKTILLSHRKKQSYKLTNQSHTPHTKGVVAATHNNPPTSGSNDKADISKSYNKHNMVSASVGGKGVTPPHRQWKKYGIGNTGCAGGVKKNSLDRGANGTTSKRKTQLRPDKASTM
jgi:hypothetical protein